MTSARKLSLFLVVAACVFTLSFASPSQTATGRIHGVVRDQTGGAIAGATVTITNVAGGITRSLTADESGAYSASDLVPGAYMIRATLPGFQAWERPNISLEAAGNLAIDVVLLSGTHSGITILTEVPRPLRMLCSTAVRAAMEELRPQMERAAKRPVALTFDSTQRLSAMIDAGERFDIAVLSADSMNSYVQKGAIAADSRAYLGRTGVGIGVRAGAPKPDISTPAKLKQALLNAKSITLNPTGASFAHFNRIAAQLGIAEQLKPKLVFAPALGEGQKNVAEGKAELLWTQVSEIAPYPELSVAGALPAELQSYTDFYIGVSAKSADHIDAAAVVKFLTSAEAKPVFTKRYVEVR
jgi:molybdate transport system substrate-binding protein